MNQGRGSRTEIHSMEETHARRSWVGKENYETNFFISVKMYIKTIERTHYPPNKTEQKTTVLGQNI